MPSVFRIRSTSSSPNVAIGHTRNCKSICGRSPSSSASDPAGKSALQTFQSQMLKHSPAGHHGSGNPHVRIMINLIGPHSFRPRYSSPCHSPLFFRRICKSAVVVMVNHQLVIPPSMQIFSPVMNPALSEQRNITIFAISIGLPTRPTGCCKASVIFISRVKPYRSIQRK